MFRSKSDKIRTIYPPESVFEILREHKEIQDKLKSDFESAGGEWQCPEAVFTNVFGGWLEGGAVYRCLMKHLANIGVTDVRMHDLRHPYVKHKTKINSMQRQKSLNIKVIWDFCLCYIVQLSIKQYQLSSSLS